VRISIRAILFASFALLNAAPVYAQQAFLPPYTTPNSQAAASPWMDSWAGFGGFNHGYGGWAGFNYALNPAHNLWADGFLLLGEGGAGHYDYPTIFVPGGRANVTYETGAALLGYRKVIPGIGITTTLSGYVGAEVQNHNNPDPTAGVRGTQWGVKFLGVAYTRLSQYQDFWGMASFSTAFDTWYVAARPGFLVTSVGSGIQLWIGPDGQILGSGQGWLENAGSCPSLTSGGLGSCKYDEGRIGGFVHIIVPNAPLGDWIIAGGYRKPLLANGGPDGYYALVGTYYPFR
jgi:hypothetical protein